MALTVVFCVLILALALLALGLFLGGLSFLCDSEMLISVGTAFISFGFALLMICIAIFLVMKVIVIT